MRGAAGDGAIPLAGMAASAAARDEDKSTKDIGDVIEYLSGAGLPALRPKSWNPFSARPRR